MAPRTPLLFFLCMFSWLVLSCDSDSTRSNIDPSVQGFWIESDAEGGLIIDGDGYGWGVMIEADGDVTQVRMEWATGQVVDDAGGPMFTMLSAADGSFTTSEGDSGTYVLSTTVSSTGAVHPFIAMTLSGQPTAYYVKMANIDGSLAVIDTGSDVQEDDMTTSDGPSDATMTLGPCETGIPFARLRPHDGGEEFGGSYYSIWFDACYPVNMLQVQRLVVDGVEQTIIDQFTCGCGNVYPCHGIGDVHCDAEYETGYQYSIHIEGGFHEGPVTSASTFVWEVTWGGTPHTFQTGRNEIACVASPTTQTCND